MELIKIYKRGDGMAVFYDPKDDRDLGRIKAILDEGGIEYFLRREPAAGIGSMQVVVAEEDIPKAEKLLRKAELKKKPQR